MIDYSNKIMVFDNVYVSYGNTIVLKNITFSLNKGDIFGYLGPNGAGKTTTIYTILGLLKPTSGKYSIFTKEIGFVLDKPGLFDELSLIENLNLFSKFGLLHNPHCEKSDIKKLLDKVGLSGYERKPVRKLSTGMKKRGEVARALLNSPELLILDEPTSGLDPIGQIEIREMILELVNSKQCTIFITSHNLAEIESLCNSFAIINRGEIVTQNKINVLHERGTTLEKEYVEKVKQ